MPFDFSIDVKHDIVFSKASGIFTYGDALSHMDRLSRHPDFRPTFNQFVDFYEVTEILLSHDEIRDLAQRTIFAPDSHRALLVTQALHFGIGRTFETYREIAGERGIRIFTDAKEARSWAFVPEETP